MLIFIVPKGGFKGVCEECGKSEGIDDSRHAHKLIVVTRVWSDPLSEIIIHGAFHAPCAQKKMAEIRESMVIIECPHCGTKVTAIDDIISQYDNCNACGMSVNLDMFNDKGKFDPT